MKTSDFEYELPQELIAQTPIEPRDHSRLLVLHRDDGSMEHRRFTEITDFLVPGDVLVLNDSRVIPARLLGLREGGSKAEILLLHRLEEGIWETLVKPSKHIDVGDKIEVMTDDSKTGGVSGVILQKKDHGLRTIRFDNELKMERLGHTPLPPYIHAALYDSERYQTVYARNKGSVAAPTAGLHFTPQLIDKFKEKEIELAFVTLHVGLDSFRPIRVEDPHLHQMHSEYGELNEEVASKLSQAKSEGRRIVSVGTTTMRLLEQVAPETDKGQIIKSFRGWVSLFILPGYRFRLVDALLTNFHLPRSTLLMLVCAFAGKELIDHAYQEAVRSGYRFYSFGDAMLVC